MRFLSVFRVPSEFLLIQFLDVPRLETWLDHGEAWLGATDLSDDC